MARGGKLDKRALSDVKTKHERLQSLIHKKILIESRQEEENRTSKVSALARLKYWSKSLKGKYFLASDAISRRSPHISEDLWLRAFHSSSGRLAVFDLGVIFGMMIIGKSDEEIGERLVQGEWRGERLHTRSESESDVTETYRDEYTGRDGSKGVRDDVILDDEPGSFDYSQSPIRPKKRQRTNEPAPIRLCFRWRGYNTITGLIQPENTGYLDLTGGVATTIRGVMRTDIAEADIFSWAIRWIRDPVT